MNVPEEMAPPIPATSDAPDAKLSRRARSPADKDRKIVFTITEADYQKIALWCYERGQRVEQVAKELLLARFAE